MKSINYILLVVAFMFSSCDNPEIDSVSDELLLKSGSKVLNFRTHLKGLNEVPANNSSATGQAIFQLSKDGKQLSYKLIVDEITNVTMAHIHLAPAGSNGAVVVWLYPMMPPPQLIEGPVNGVLAEGIITKDNLRGALAGKDLKDLIQKFYKDSAYVNVHTSQFAGGEIRGQITGTMSKSFE